MLLVIFGLFGLIIGSFVNVVVLRSGARALSGRSACMSCGAQIQWFDLIPVFSWLALRGRCRACGSRISVQYPAVELSMAISFALVGGASLPPLAMLIALLMCAILVAITAYDILHTIIPDSWVYTFAALAFLSSLLTTNYVLLTILSGPVVALPLFVLWLVSKGRWMGLGDPKLALGIGWLLGPLAGIQAVLLAFVIGAIVGLWLIAFSSAALRKIAYEFTHTLTLASLLSVFHFNEGKGASTYEKDDDSSPLLQQKTMPMLVSGYTIKSEIPFGPFLVVACLLVWISQMYSISIPFLWQ